MDIHTFLDDNIASLAVGKNTKELRSMDNLGSNYRTVTDGSVQDLLLPMLGTH